MRAVAPWRTGLVLPGGRFSRKPFTTCERPSFILSALCLGLLSGCASGRRTTIPPRDHRRIVADDGKLYLLPAMTNRCASDAAPFRDYRALMDSPLREGGLRAAVLP
jgi:hypothetical protein